MYSLGFRIDMSLTRDHIYSVISMLNQSGRPFTVSEIAELAHCHRATVFRALRDLESAGRLRVISGHGVTPSVYQLIGRQHDQP